MLVNREIHRRGAVAVEFAFVAPLLFLLIIGMMELGRVVMVQQILTNAAREGARRGILEQATTPEVESLVADYLADASIPGASVTVSPQTLTNVEFGDPVTVNVSIPYDDISWVSTRSFLSGKNLSAQCIMRSERL